MGMLTDFTLIQFNGERNAGDPIIIEKQGVAERRAGGKHVSTLSNIIAVVRGLSLRGRGTRNMNPGEDGVRFNGSREFQIVKSDLDAIGITLADEKYLRVFHAGQVHKVTAMEPLGRERIVRLFTERTRDDYPTFIHEWDFEDDTVGQAPESCTVTVPTGTTAAVAIDGTTNVVAMTSAATKYSQVAINVLDECEGPAITIEFDFKITGTLATGNVARFILGEITDLIDLGSNVLLYLLVVNTGGVLSITDFTGTLFTKTITASSWVHVKAVGSKGLGSVEINGEEVISDVDISGFTVLIKHLLTCGIAASGATIELDNVEVDCVAR